MANFLKGALGNDGIAQMAGQKAGEFVEQTVKNVMAGGAKKGEEGQEKKEGGEGGAGKGAAAGAGAGAGGGGGGGFAVEDALSLVSGKKEEGGGGGGGLDVGKTLGGFFK